MCAAKTVRIAPEVEFSKGTPPTNVAIETVTTSYHNPREHPNLSDTVIFDIAASELYTDLQSPFRIKYCIQKRALNADDWVPIQSDAAQEEAETSIVDNILHSLWSQVHLRLNNDLISRSTGLYPQLASFINTYNYSQDAKSNWLYCHGFHPDTPNHMDAIDNTNPAYVKRKNRIANGRVDEVMGSLYFPLSTDKLRIPPGTRINLSLHKSPIAFLLKRTNNGNEYRVNFIEMHWILKRIKYSETISRSVNQTLGTSSGGVMPLNYMFPSNFTLPIAQQAFDLEISSGKIPYEIAIGFIPTQAFLGHRTQNPFNFSHNNLQEIQLKCEDQNIPFQPLKMDFAGGRYMEAYRYTFCSAGQFGRQSTANIKYEDWPNGNCFHIFNLRADESNSLQYYPETKTGHIRVILKFTANLAAALTMFVIRSYNNQINVNRIREFTGNTLTY